MKFGIFGLIAILSFDSFVLSSPFDDYVSQNFVGVVSPSNENDVETITDSLYDIPDEEPETEIMFMKEESKDENICSTKKCLDTSSLILNSLDSSVDPCDNFYRFACGNWIAENPVSKDHTATSNFFVSRDENKEIIFDILKGNFKIDENSNSEDKKNDMKLLGYIQNFYNSCVDTDSINRKGSKPMNIFLDQLKLNTRKYNNTDVLTKTLAELHNYDIGSLFNFELTAPPSKSNKENYVLTITENSGTFDNFEDDESVEIYRKQIKTSFSIVYGNRKDKNIDKMTEAILKFERQISLVANQYVFIEEDFDDSIIKYKDLVKKYKFVNWELYFKSRYNTIKDFKGLSDDIEILLFPSEYFDTLNKVISKTSSETLAIYLEWCTINSYINYLSEKTIKPLDDIYESMKSPEDEEEEDPNSRSEKCFEQANNMMPMAIGRYFIEKLYSKQKKEYAEKTLEYVKLAMINRVAEMDWLEEETVEYALKKVSAITQEVGGPDYVFSSEKVMKKYENLDFTYDSYFDNIIIYNQYKVRSNLSNLNKKFKVTDILETAPYTINAFYTPHANRIYIPAGILQPPFFNSEIPDYLNFGSLGTVLGHELTHAFDSTGKNYDIDGKLKNWWVDNDLEEYEGLSECFIDQYDKFEYKDKDGEEHFINGVKSLDENLADNGGLSRAYEAWQLSLKEDGSKKNNQKLPGLTQYTNEQLFFISFSQVWCANYYPDSWTLKKLTSDEHSPENARVNGSVSNSKYFAKAFNCPAKSPMNPKEKCTIW